MAIMMHKYNDNIASISNTTCHPIDAKYLIGLSCMELTIQFHGFQTKKAKTKQQGKRLETK